MFNFKEMKELYRFIEEVDQCYNIYFDVSEGKIFIEFYVKEFKQLEKFVKDWLLFHSDIISSYDVEWTDDDVCRFNLFLRKC